MIGLQVKKLTCNLLKMKIIRNLRVYNSLLVYAIILFSFFGSVYFIHAATSSTAVVKTQYFSPSSSPYSSSYSSFLTSPNSGNAQEQFFDMEVFIPPLGCQPYVVRSDLLEEQNVPVFCKLVPLKINPSIDITRISSLSITQKGSNPYISGVGFHPANAAIRSTSSLTSTPSSDNLGYVVVVLKRQENENQMPDTINVTLAASVEYSANYAYGIGESQYYLPVLSDEDFTNSYEKYSFFNGKGFLRVEDMDANSAVISIYSSEGASSSGFRRIFSNRIALGKTSSDFYLPTNTGGQGLRVSLKEITIPQTSAKIKINGQEFEVYKSGSFYNGKCSLKDVSAFGGGTGYARVYCLGKSFDLTKSFNMVDMLVAGVSRSLSLGDKLDEISGADSKDNFYLAYVGEIMGSQPRQYYSFVANISKSESSNSEDVRTRLRTVSEKLDKKINEIKKQAVNTEDFKNRLSQITSISSGFFSKEIKLIFVPSGVKSEKIDVFFNDWKSSNRPLEPLAEKYFTKSTDSYDIVNDRFNLEPYINKTYGEASLWAEYSLATDLAQNEKANEILSRIENDYPGSRYNGKTATDYLSLNNMYSSKGASAYHDKEDLYIELVSVNTPSSEDASVDLTAIIGTTTNTLTSLSKNSLISDPSDNLRVISLVSFDEEKIYLNYSCKDNSASGRLRSGNVNGEKGSDIVIADCNSRIVVNNIHLNKVAKIQITPTVTGRSRESNFTFAISIEKRPELFELTPQEANKQIEKLNKQIAEWKNLTETLSKVIVAEKAACVATSALINIKNLFAGIGGEATARREVMKRWNELCSSVEEQKNANANSIEECIANRYDDFIKPEIESTQKSMSDYNTLYENFKTQTGNNVTRIKELIAQNVLNSININAQVNCQTPSALAGQSSASVCETLNKEKIASVLNPINLSGITPSELTDLYFMINMAQSSGLSQESKTYYLENLNSKLNQYRDRMKSSAQVLSLSKALGANVDAYGGEKVQDITTNLDNWAEIKGKFSNPEMLGSYSGKIKIYDYASYGSFLATLTLVTGRTYNINKLYSITASGTTFTLSEASEKIPAEVRNFRFTEGDPMSYKNTCKNCNEMKVFTLDPYKGMPALLPFDSVEGWYVQIKQTMPAIGTGNVKSYQDSGRVNTFWLCNVGKNGLMEQVGVNDDICRRFDMYTGDTLDSFPGLTNQQARAKVSQGLKAIESAQSQLVSGSSKITISQPSGGILTLRVKSSEGDLGSKCTDFMSPDDCQLIFNVCDPVVCPNSRCDLGGTYPVDNVIQSGIVGSTLLCLPNFIGFHPNTGVVLPVCLTGINAGIESWTGILESYRDCLNESVTNNKTVGICDMIYSVYTCDFFWRQAGPFTESLINNVFTTLVEGKGGKGGGEYAFTSDALSNAEKSAQFLQTTYGSNSKLAFGFNDLAQTAVSEVCKSPFSVTYPNKFDTMLEPESPVQFYASFEEVPFNSATLPATSQYSVSYYIYAGNDQGHYYQIYLKSAPTSLGYVGKESSLITSGFIEKGQKISYKKDLLDVSGFKELCVKIDLQEECGFKSVSTSFALNYAKDKVISGQAASNITSESECIAGSNSLGSFLTPNIQQGVEEFANPEIYNSGIIRVCSTEDPGAGVDDKRWQYVGYCDDRSVGCWIDTQSVEKAIRGKGIENDTLWQINNLNRDYLISQGGYFDATQGARYINNLKTVYNKIVDLIKPNDVSSVDSASYSSSLLDFNNLDYKGRKLVNLEEDIKALSDKLIYTNQKAELAFFKASVYDAVARKVGKSVIFGVKDESGAGSGSLTQASDASNNPSGYSDNTDSSNQENPTFSISDAALTYTADNADVIGTVCGVLGFASVTTSLAAKNAVSALESAPNALIESGTLVESVSGGSRIAITNIRGVSYVQEVGSGKILGQVGSGFRILKLPAGTTTILDESGKALAVAETSIGKGFVEGLKLATDTPKIVDAGGKALEGGIVVASKSGALKFASTALTKSAPFLQKASLVLAPLTIASTLCDVGTLIVVIGDSNKALAIMDESSKAADASLSSLVRTVSLKVINVNVQISKIQNNLNGIEEEDPVLVREISPKFEDIKNKFETVKDNYNAFKTKYTEYLTNSEIQPRPKILYVIPVGTTSQFSDREYSELQTLERTIRQDLVEIQNTADEISGIMLDLVSTSS
jgi:hypothetical protein